jgi:hypothetical protein
LDAITTELDEDFIKAALDRPRGEDRPPVEFPE